MGDDRVCCDRGPRDGRMGSVLAPDQVLRTANAALCALLAVLLLVHTAGGAAGFAFGAPRLPVWLAWLAVALGAAHALACVGTSWFMLTDQVRPPSARKKRHLLLKWVTGGIMVLVAALHVLAFTGTLGAWGLAAGPASLAVYALSAALAGAALAVHLCVGAKSLLKDLNLSRSWRMPFRVVCCAVLAGACIALALGMF